MKTNSEPSVLTSQPQKEVWLSREKSLSTVAIISSKLLHAFSGGQIMATSLHHVWHSSLYMKKIS